MSTYIGSVSRCSIAIFAPTLVIERKSCSLRRKMRYICKSLLCGYLILFTIFNVKPSKCSRHPKPGLAPRVARRYTERKGYANSFAIFFPKRICPIYNIGCKTEYRNVHLYYPAYYTPIGYYAASIPDLKYIATCGSAKTVILR